LDILNQNCQASGSSEYAHFADCEPVLLKTRSHPTGQGISHAFVLAGGEFLGAELE
jgi:hypothetical protein